MGRRQSERAGPVGILQMTRAAEPRAMPASLCSLDRIWRPGRGRQELPTAATRAARRVMVRCAGLFVVVMLVCSGCSMFQKTFGGGGQSSGASSKNESGSGLPRAIQAEVMRFADRYATRVAEASETVRRRVPTPEARLEMLQWKLTQATGVYTDATDASPIVGTVDSVTLATLSRMVAEDYWVGQKYGDLATPLLEVHRQLEAESWVIAKRVLNADQVQQLTDFLAAWRAAHPDQTAVYRTRLLDFAAYAGESSSAQSSRPSSLLGVLRVDPLAGLEPTARSIEEARLLGERSTYYLQRMPTLLSWHAEWLSYSLAVTPESRQLLADADRLSKAAEVFAKTAEQLPQVINDQREAAIQQVFDNLNANSRNLRASLVELRGSLQAGTEMAKSTDAAIQSLDRFVGRFQKGPAAAGPAAQSRPFDILDYATTARDITATMAELNATLAALDQRMPQVATLTGLLENTGNRLLLRLLWVGVLLIIVLVGAVTGAALLYRRLNARAAN